MEELNRGTLIISLDLELFWGVNDSKKFSEYEENIREVPKVVSQLLEVFRKYNIKASFATVGSLLFNDEEELLSYYQAYNKEDINLPNYNYLKQNLKFISDNKDCFFLDSSIIDNILFEGHELCSHTFSHLYHLQEKNIKTLIIKDHQLINSKIYELTGENLKSIVFPRNQFNKEVLSVYRSLGYKAFRGNEKGFFYKAAKTIEKNKLHLRALRYIDSAINISGYNTYQPNWELDSFKNVKSSYFLRPHSNFKLLNDMRLMRIKNNMTHAAINSEYFHLWWHPHNFGKNLNNNLKNLESILEHYRELNSKYKMCNSVIGNV